MGWRFWRKREAVPSVAELAPSHQEIVIQLKDELNRVVEETEQLARIKHLEWKIRKANEKKAWLEHGVKMPTSPHQLEEDRLYEEMEHRIQRMWEDAERKVEERREKSRSEEAERDQIEAHRKLSQAVTDALI